jgi:hypothetical protein
MVRDQSSESRGFTTTTSRKTTDQNPNYYSQTQTVCRNPPSLSHNTKIFPETRGDFSIRVTIRKIIRPKSPRERTRKSLGCSKTRQEERLFRDLYRIESEAVCLQNVGRKGGKEVQGD